MILRVELEERLKMVNVILFDLDGTLVDTIELITESFRYATKTVLGRDIPDDLLIKEIGIPLQAQMENFSKEKADELSRVYQDYYRDRHDSMMKEYPGVRETLDELIRRGYRLAVVTSRRRFSSERSIELYGFGHYFDLLVAMDDVPEHKPLPRPILEALGGLGAYPEEAIYVGDSPHDMAAGHAAGVVTAAALWGPFSKERLLAERPDLVLSGLPELLEHVRPRAS